MLNPIEKSSSINSQSPFFEGPTLTHRQWESSITSIKTKPVDFQKRFKDILDKLWNFIKVYFLFFCFDQDSEANAEKLKQIKSFIELYYEAKGKDHDSQTERVVREFSNLRESVREDIKSQVEAVMKEEFPNKNTKYYKECTRRVLENPLEDPEKARKPVQVFATAILRVQEKYAGFHETL